MQANTAASSALSSSNSRRTLESGDSDCSDSSQAKRPCFGSASKVTQAAQVALPATTSGAQLIFLPRTTPVSVELAPFLSTLNLATIQNRCDYFQARTSGRYKDKTELTVDELGQFFEKEDCFKNHVALGKSLLAAISKQEMPPLTHQDKERTQIHLTSTITLLHQAQFLGVKSIEEFICAHIQAALKHVNVDTLLHVLSTINLPPYPQLARTLLNSDWFHKLDELNEISPRLLSEEAIQLIQYCQNCGKEVKNPCHFTFDYQNTTRDRLITELCYCPQVQVLQIDCTDMPYTDAIKDPYEENSAIFTNCIEGVLELDTIKTLCFSTDCFSEKLLESLIKSNLERIGFELYPRSNDRNYQTAMISKILDALEANPSVKEVAVCDYSFKDSKPSRPFKLITDQSVDEFRDAEGKNL
ncbi:MAG: hypothetical protein LLG04_16335 [Parachlamydia sp.]|nr:hypothetical protein [Parachlamydia sp.]